MTPQQFVTERLDEIEAYARNTRGHPFWTTLDQNLTRAGHAGTVDAFVHQLDPDTVLADVHAKRHILEIAGQHRDSTADLERAITRELARPYTDHDDYMKVEWF